jgi:hypothetical protein
LNPFYYGQIVKAENFCRRPELVEKLGSNIKRGQSVYIQGERRTGKSSLVFETIRNLKKFRLIYVDLLEAKGLASTMLWSQALRLPVLTLRMASPGQRLEQKSAVLGILISSRRPIAQSLTGASIHRRLASRIGIRRAILIDDQHW